jgi:flavin-dependent dehydrogenase
MPDGIAALQRLGVTIPATEAYRFRGIRFVSSGFSAEAAFPSGSGLGVRRTNLHRIMIEHAERAGVRLLWDTVVTGLHANGVLLRDKLVPSRWIIGADGGSSQVRRWASLDVHRRRDQRFAFRRHYRIAPWAEFMQLHWGVKCQLYVTPVSSEEVCVALISRNPRLRLDEALRKFPEVSERLRGVEHESIERGAVSVSRTLAHACNERVALIGDASGGVDAITGEGLCLAFNQANLLADCLASGDLVGYEKGHRALARRPAMMARLMLLLEHREWLRRRMMQAFTTEPKLLAHMLATHIGAASPVNIAANGLALGWKLLTA